MIAWRPIAEMPAELKDGREVLLWEGVCDWAELTHWDGQDWHNIACINFTHYAEITPPCLLDA